MTRCTCCRLIVLLLLRRFDIALALYSYAKGDTGSLTGDVQNWAMLVQNYILQVSYRYEIRHVMLRPMITA